MSTLFVLQVEHLTQTPKLPPKEAAQPQKAASANPPAFNLLTDTEAFPFIN